MINMNEVYAIRTLKPHGLLHVMGMFEMAGIKPKDQFIIRIVTEGRKKHIHIEKYVEAGKW
jgi:hypothetical protein